MGLLERAAPSKKVRVNGEEKGRSVIQDSISDGPVKLALSGGVVFRASRFDLSKEDRKSQVSTKREER